MIDEPMEIDGSHRTPIQKVSDEFVLARLAACNRAGHSRDGERFIPIRLKKLHIEAKEEAARRGLTADFTPPECDPPPEHFRHSRIRYMDESRLEAFVRGEISLGDSRNYKEDPHAGRRDDEMRKSYFISNEPVTIKNETYKVLKAQLHLDIADEKGPIHYHFLSLSWQKSRKLAREFNAEGSGCVMIHDYPLFVKLLRAAITERYPESDFCAREVTYYDDLAPIHTTDFWEAVNFKSINYFYQYETRISVINAFPRESRLNITIKPPSGLLEIQRF